MRDFRPSLPIATAAATLFSLSIASAQAPARPAAAPSPPMFTAPEYVIGNPRARVSVVEYASVACPHCARFDATVWPAFKARYVDTGKVRFAYREMLVGDDTMMQVAAGGFLLARCAGRAHYWQVVEDVYRAQPEIFAKGEIRGPFDRIGHSVGLSDAQIQACLADKPAIAALNARVDEAANKAHIDGTPTLVINGVKAFTGEVDLPRLGAAVDAALHGRPVPPAPKDPAG